jgi:hypothetical protein
MLPREAFFAPVEHVPAERAAGRIAAEMISPCPPGVPALAPCSVDRGAQRASPSGLLPGRTDAGGAGARHRERRTRDTTPRIADGQRAVGGAGA